MKILFSPFSPYVRKCLVTGMELGLNDSIQLLPSQAHPVQRDRAIIAVNPLGQVPTFFTDDNVALYDSRVICEYLNDWAQGQLFPHGAQRWNALTLQSLGDGMLDAALSARYEEVARPATYRWQDWQATQLDKIHTSLTMLDKAPHTLANRLDIGVIAVGCALWYLDLRFADLAWRERYSAVAQWYATFSLRPAMQHNWQLPNP